jgi:hypothetical protein
MLQNMPSVSTNYIDVNTKMFIPVQGKAINCLRCHLTACSDILLVSCACMGLVPGLFSGISSSE